MKKLRLSLIPLSVTLLMATSPVHATINCDSPGKGVSLRNAIEEAGTGFETAHQRELR